MFVFPNPEMDCFPEDVDLMNKEKYSRISPNLYRVQKLTSGTYYFRNHLETILTYDSPLKDITWKRIQTTNYLKGVVKVRVNHIGNIVSVGEYD